MGSPRSSDKGAACDAKAMVNWITTHREEWGNDLITLLYKAECDSK